MAAAAKEILALRYRVRVDGIVAVSQLGTRGILFLPNHPALIDPVILIAHLHGPFGVRAVATEDGIDAPIVRSMSKLLGTLRVPTLSEPEQGSTVAVQRSIELCIDALRQGDNVLFYPAGRLMRRRVESLGGVTGTHHIVSTLPDVRIVLVRTTGLLGQLFQLGLRRAAHIEKRLGGSYRANVGQRPILDAKARRRCRTGRAG